MNGSHTPERGAEAGAFLHTLFSGKPDELYLLMWTLPEKRSRWFREVAEAIVLAESLSNQDVYVGVGYSNQDYGAIHRCPSDEIVGIWADIDLKSDAHPKAALPTTVEAALGILPSEFPPSFLISTGNGIHAWWLFREPLIFANGNGRREAGTLVHRWQTLLRLSAASRGWAFDRLADLARVLRIPGTTNCKDLANPKPVEICHQTDRRYNPSELEKYLDDERIPGAAEDDRAAQLWQAHFADTPLTIDPSATVPEDLLANSMASDSRFEATWRRRRDDLKDQSQSGYDLALANFGAGAGLSEQQMVDLIVHHRRIHGQRPRTRLDYYQRTIARALNQTDGVPAIVLKQGPTPPP